MANLEKISICMTQAVKQHLKEQAKRRGISLSRLASQALTTDKTDLLEERQRLRQEIFALRAELSLMKGGSDLGTVESTGTRKEK